MSRIITIITVVGAALVFAVPAFGQDRPDAWSDGMNRLYGLGEYAPEVRAERLRSEGLNKLYGLGEYATTSSIEARERGMIFRPENPTIAMLDGREQAFAEKRNVQLATGIQPDVVDRAVAARVASDSANRFRGDDRFRIDPTTQPITSTVSSSGSDREIAWPSVGIGFGVGIALLLGVLLALRVRRQPPLAH